MRAGPSARYAIAASLGVHAILAAGLVAWLRATPTDSRPVATVETRADVHFEFPVEKETPSEVLPAFVPDPPPTPSSPETPVEPQPVPDGPPLVQSIAVPKPLPAEMLAILKRPPVPQAIQPVVAVVRKGPAWAASGSPVHGALDARQCIVYVLDASGSMGEWGKFDAARGALIATLKLQPPTVRFQVVVYSGTAFAPLRSAPGECRPATAENLARILDALADLPAPAGRSNHLEGLRAALGYRPDLIVLFTDADDLPAAPIRGLLKQASRAVTLCTAKATAKGVEPPVEVK